jgi:hypothetical protein
MARAFPANVSFDFSLINLFIFILPRLYGHKYGMDSGWI